MRRGRAKAVAAVVLAAALVACSGGDGGNDDGDGGTSGGGAPERQAPADGAFEFGVLGDFPYTPAQCRCSTA